MKRENYGVSGRTREAAMASNGRRHRKKKHKNRALTLFLLILVVVAAAVVLSLTVFFNIEKIEVSADTSYSETDIIKTSGILIGDNMFRIKTDEIEKKLDKQMPYLSNVKVKRKLPNKIEISADKAEPVGAIKYESSYFLISSDLKVLETDVMVIKEGVPVIIGTEDQKPEAGSYLNNSEIDDLNILFSLTKAMEDNNLNNINKIDLSNLMDIKITCDDRIELLVGGPTELEYKMKFAKFLLDSSIEENEKGTIDVRLNTPGQATFRPLKEESSQSLDTSSSGSSSDSSDASSGDSSESLPNSSQSSSKNED